MGGPLLPSGLFSLLVSFAGGCWMSKACDDEVYRCGTRSMSEVVPPGLLVRIGRIEAVNESAQLTDLAVGLHAGTRGAMLLLMPSLPDRAGSRSAPIWSHAS